MIQVAAGHFVPASAATDCEVRTIAARRVALLTALDSMPEHCATATLAELETLRAAITARVLALKAACQ
jgi:uncharacterized metal-binding protein